MFSCFVLGKHTLNWLQASKLDEERERERARKQGHLGWVRSGAVYVHENCFINIFRDDDVNLMAM